LRVYELVHVSAHAKELLESSDTVGHVSVGPAHVAYLDELAERLVACGASTRGRAAELAKTLSFSAEGVIAKAGSREQAEGLLRVLVRRFAAPVPSAPRKR
jgi:hypothetical protein